MRANRGHGPLLRFLPRDDVARRFTAVGGIVSRSLFALMARPGGVNDGAPSGFAMCAIYSSRRNAPL